MIGKFAPQQDLLVVSAIFGESPKIQDEVERTIAEVEPGRTWERYEGLFSFDDCFVGDPPPGAAHKKRVLVFSPKPDKFALITANLEDGWNSLAYRLTRDLKTRGLILGFCTDNVQFPARFFSLIENGKSVRDVSVRLGDKWEFFESGDTLIEESRSAYGNRIIKSRLTNEHLIELAKKFEIPLDCQSRIEGAGILLCQAPRGNGLPHRELNLERPRQR